MSALQEDYWVIEGECAVSNSSASINPIAPILEDSLTLPGPQNKLPESEDQLIMRNLYGDRQSNVLVDWIKASEMSQKGFQLLLLAERGDYKTWYLKALKLHEHRDVCAFATLNPNKTPWLTRMAAAAVARVTLGDVWPSSRQDKEALCCLIGELVRESKSNAHAEMWLAFCYEHGLGLEKSDEYAQELYNTAAQKGQVRALYWMGRHYASQGRTSEDFQVTSEAAYRGFPPAQHRLSECLRLQLPLDESMDSLARARHWWNEARAQGFAPALSHSVFTDEKPEERSTAIRVGHPLACLRSVNSAFWLRKGTLDHGMVKMYHDIIQVRDNWLDYLSAVGESYRSLGMLYAFGHVEAGVIKDVSKAVRYLETCDDITQRADVQFTLGCLYIKSDTAESCEAFRRKGKEWFRKAALQAHLEAQVCIGDMERLADGSSSAEAARWFKVASDRGHARATSVLGVLYESGSGVTQDKRMALKLYKRSAEAGDAVGKYLYGWCLEIGMGTDPNARRAQDLYAQAIEQGHDLAKTRLNDMLRHERDGGFAANLRKRNTDLITAIEANDLSKLQDLSDNYLDLSIYWSRHKRLLDLCAQAPRGAWGVKNREDVIVE